MLGSYSYVANHQQPTGLTGGDTDRLLRKYQVTSNDTESNINITNDYLAAQIKDRSIDKPLFQNEAAVDNSTRSSHFMGIMHDGSPHSNGDPYLEDGTFLDQIFIAGNDTRKNGDLNWREYKRQNDIRQENIVQSWASDQSDQTIAEGGRTNATTDLYKQQSMYAGLMPRMKIFKDSLVSFLTGGTKTNKALNQYEIVEADNKIRPISSQELTTTKQVRQSYSNAVLHTAQPDHRILLGNDSINPKIVSYRGKFAPRNSSNQTINEFNTTSMQNENFVTKQKIVDLSKKLVAESDQVKKLSQTQSVKRSKKVISENFNALNNSVEQEKKVNHNIESNTVSNKLKLNYRTALNNIVASQCVKISKETKQIAKQSKGSKYLNFSAENERIKERIVENATKQAIKYNDEIKRHSDYSTVRGRDSKTVIYKNLGNTNHKTAQNAALAELQFVKFKQNRVGKFAKYDTTGQYGQYINYDNDTDNTRDTQREHKKIKTVIDSNGIKQNTHRQDSLEGIGENDINDTMNSVRSNPNIRHRIL